MQTNLRTLGPKEATLVLSLREQDRQVVSAAEIIELLGSEPTARKVIHNLLRKGWLSRLIGGRYMFLPPEHGPENLGENNVLALASAIVEPAYIGWWAAASFHGFTTQKPMAISVATQRAMPPRAVEGTEIRFIKVAARKFFGFEPYDVYGRAAPLSSPAKTVVDCIDRPDLAGGPAELTRIVFGAADKVGAAELADAACRMRSTALLQRLGFLADLAAWPMPDGLRDRLRAAIAKSARATFGRPERKDDDIGYVADWGLFVHARRDDLLADAPRRRPSTS
jgi:predicted transcriptional regulator of viral defense system